MNAIFHSSTNALVGEALDWDREPSGPSPQPMPVTVADGQYTTHWIPSAEEREAIASGASIVLTIRGKLPLLTLTTLEKA
jgi:hypothetical protein